MNWKQSDIYNLSRGGWCVVQGHTPAPLPQVPPGSAQSAVILAAEANNMWVKQVAAILDGHPDKQLAHGSIDEEDHGCPPSKKQ